MVNHYQRLFNSTELHKVIGLPETGKMLLFPIDNHKILIRLENIADLFDSEDDDNNNSSAFVKVNEIAKIFYQKATGSVKETDAKAFDIQETSLTANQPL